MPAPRTVDAYGGNTVSGFLTAEPASPDDGSALETVQQIGVASMSPGRRRHTNQQWRDGLKSFLRHRVGYTDPDSHPAQMLSHAQHMAHSLNEMAGAAPDDSIRDACDAASEMLAETIPDLEYDRAGLVDDLSVPTMQERHRPMLYEGFDPSSTEFLGTALHELHGLAGFAAQDCVAAVENDAWRAARDEFLKHCSQYSGDGLQTPAMPLRACTTANGCRKRSRRWRHCPTSGLAAVA